MLGVGTYALTIPPPEDSIGNERFGDADDNINGDLDVSGTLTIVGRGADLTSITTNRADRILEALPDSSVMLSKLGVKNGYTPHGGGGLWVNAGAALAVQLSSLNDNLSAAAFTTCRGGAIYNAGTLTVVSTRFERNRTSDGEGPFGGGGAIYNIGSLTVRESSFIANQATNDDDAGLGGAIFSSGNADIRRSSFERNHVYYNGAGAAILNSGNGTLLLDNSTVTSSPDFSDGYEPGVAAVENGSKFERRFPVAPVQIARIVNSTIAGNEIRGLMNRGDITVINSIIAGNGYPGSEEFGEPAQHDNCFTTGVNSRFIQRGLLRGTDTGHCPTTLLVLNADTFRTVLWPLAANNNEFLPTFALRKVSIAIDAAVGNCATQDQRGSERPRDGNGDGIAACDIGAYERPRP